MDQPSAFESIQLKAFDSAWIHVVIPHTTFLFLTFAVCNLGKYHPPYSEHTCNVLDSTCHGPAMRICKSAVL